MKSIYRIISGVAVLAALSACSLNHTPEFSQDDSFVAFASTTIAVKEDAGSVLLPVNMACVDPIKANITYSIVEGGTAVERTDFTLDDEFATLVFDGKTRSASIKINIASVNVGKFTGDKNFVIALNEPKGVGLGNSRQCAVTIQDIDHPLNDILGTWKASALDYYANAVVSWNLSINKVEGSLTAVRISGIISDDPNSYVVGEVSGTIGSRVITVAFGQDLVGYSTSYDAKFSNFIVQSDGTYSSLQGNIILTQGSDGTITADNGYAALAMQDGKGLGFFIAYTHESIVWTKID